MSPQSYMIDGGGANCVKFAGFQYCNGPQMTQYLNEMNEILEKYDAMTVGECPHTPDMARVLKYVSAKEKQLNMVFQFVSLRPSPAPKYADRKPAGRRRYRPRPLQIPDNTQELHPPLFQACHRPHAGHHPRHRRMDHRLPREPRPIKVHIAVRERCSRA